MKAIRKDAWNLMRGEKVGEGWGRAVYENLLLPDTVIKVAIPGDYPNQNVMEWETWKWHQNSKIAKWLAPCRFLSPNGLILIQDRTTPFGEGERIPRMPRCLRHDLKTHNLGWYEGRVVVHDYGYVAVSQTLSTRI